MLALLFQESLNNLKLYFKPRANSLYIITRPASVNANNASTPQNSA